MRTTSSPSHHYVEVNHHLDDEEIEFYKKATVNQSDDIMEYFKVVGGESRRLAALKLSAQEMRNMINSFHPSSSSASGNEKMPILSGNIV